MTAEEALSNRNPWPLEDTPRHTVIMCMQDYARFHIEQALKAAAKNAKTTSQAIYDFDGTYCGDSCGIDEYSILNSYSFENIK